jgi:hypothetical protein
VRQTYCQHSTRAVDKSPAEHSHGDIQNFLDTLTRLKTLAQRGDALAMDLLWMTGTEVGLCLANIEANGSPEAKRTLRLIAAKRMGWPVVAMYSDKPDETRRRLRSIRLGAELSFDLDSQVRVDPLTLLAYQIIEHIGEAGAAWRARREGGTSTRRMPMYYRVAGSLPTFSRASLPRWWAVASKVFDLRHPDPGAVPWMKALARNGASASRVRTVVKRRLRQKMCGLAPRR